MTTTCDHVTVRVQIEGRARPDTALVYLAQSFGLGKMVMCRRCWSDVGGHPMVFLPSPGMYQATTCLGAHGSAAVASRVSLVRPLVRDHTADSAMWFRQDGHVPQMLE